MIAKFLFVLLLAWSLTPWTSPPLSLALGLAFGLTLGNPFPIETRRSTRWLLQASVVGLGFGMDLYQVMKAGKSGFIYTALGIMFALALGMLLARALRVEPPAG